MGEVYRATDTNLKRQVAIKVLPDAVAADAERLARFQREAEVLASLNHPNIAQIHGLEKSAGATGLVMELVEGPTLAERIAQGPIAVQEALPIAKQIAEALEAAHEQGIIHRDLKPANVKVRPDGTVKVLDFGLAKALEPGPGGQIDATASPTITSPALMTGVGMLLGTAAYMSPEQARGKAVDKRSDIWAFGCVLYEMLTGHRAFSGDDVSTMIARVIEREPDFSILPPGTPAAILRLLRRTFAKDQRLRLPVIAMARIEIDDASIEDATPLPARERHPVSWISALPWAIAAGLAIVLGAVQLRISPAASPDRVLKRVELNLPPGVELYTINQSLALSPDGTQAAFIGNVGGLRRLYVRKLDSLDAVVLPGTDTAQTCFFSPDGHALGFITADRSLKRVSLSDGLVTPITRDADLTAAATWGPDDRITFGRGGSLWQVLASGGTAVEVTKLGKDTQELFHAFPAIVNNGKAMLFTSFTSGSRDYARIEALSFTTGTRKVVVESGTLPFYTPSGHLVFFRGSSLLAAPFDVDGLTVTGPAVRVVDNLAVDATTASPLVALSSSGALIYPPSGAGTSRLVWVSRQGVEQPIGDMPRRWAYPRLAPDGHRIAVYADGSLWIQDSARPTLTLLAAETGYAPSIQVWTPNGKRVIGRTRLGLRWFDTDGGKSGPITGSTSVADIPSSVSPDGQTFAFVRQAVDTSGDIYVVNLREGSPRPLVQTRAYEGGAQFSPDGRWIAYASDESGQMQVYVRPFPDPDRKITVSTEGGTQPLWNRKGKELFYRNGNKMMVVDVSMTSDLVLSQPRELFEQRYAFLTITIPNYDVSTDGQRFLMVKDESGSGRLNLVINWQEELKRLVPTN
jgi:eukaryotic-like serine/threonine-protein kinase